VKRERSRDLKCVATAPRGGILTGAPLFVALCSFVSVEELAEALKTVPEIEMVVGHDAIDAYLASSPADAKAALKCLYSKVARADEETVNRSVGALVKRLEGSSRDLSKKEKLVLRLNKDYPLDIGILSVFFLNHVELHPGEAIFLDANEPHSYLSGELMEVMATSDNVVRMGLTPKLKDVEILLEMLTYNQVTKRLQ
jgi:mannose-6-phosphate isomerase